MSMTVMRTRWRRCATFIHIRLIRWRICGKSENNRTGGEHKQCQNVIHSFTRNVCHKRHIYSLANSKQKQSQKLIANMMAVDQKIRSVNERFKKLNINVDDEWLNG